MLKKYASFLLAFSLLNLGCASSRKYLVNQPSAITLKVNIPLQKGKSRGYIRGKEGYYYVDKGDSRKVIRNRLGLPSRRGFTLEGNEFWRYDDLNLEIYFHKGYVCGWRKINFRP